MIARITEIHPRSALFNDISKKDIIGKIVKISELDSRYIFTQQQREGFHNGLLFFLEKSIELKHPEYGRKFVKEYWCLGFKFRKLTEKEKEKYSYLFL